jgi:hypothetical protein
MLQKTAMTKERLQDFFHGNTMSVEIEGKPQIVLHSDAFNTVYDLILQEQQERKDELFKAFGDFCAAIRKQISKQ